MILISQLILQCMQQVARSLRQKNNRDRLRTKIKELTPQQYFNNIRYYHNPSLSPHKILAHQYQHLDRYNYNKNQIIGNRNIYSLSQALIYEPLRKNQLRAQEQRSKNLMHGNQFLKSYDPKQYKARKDDYYQRVQAVEKVKKQQEQSKLREIRKMKPVVLPPIKPKKSYRYLKLRSISIAILFTCIIRKRFLNFIESRSLYSFKNHKKILQSAVQVMKTYYYNQLQKEITSYIILLQKKCKYPDYNIKKDAINILTTFSQKINSLPVPISILSALKIICSNYSFFPLPYLFKQQLKRLQFSQQHQCIINMNTDRSCMLTSCLMVIKLLCYNLFYRPWLTEDLFRKKNQKYINIASKYDSLKKTINRFGSIFYFIGIDNFIFTNEIIKRSDRQVETILRQNQIEIIPFLKVTPNEELIKQLQDDTSSEQYESNQQLTNVQLQSMTQMYKNNHFEDETHLIVGQNRRFYLKIKHTYKDQFEQIQTNITDWITRITLSVLDQNNKERKERVKQFYHL